jgi:hypothetical protein
VTATVVVPSYGRAGKVSTVDVFPAPGVIVVPEKQRESYEALQELPEGWSIRSVRDDQDGNIARKRNAVLDLFPGEDIVMVDDDYDYLGSWEDGEDRRMSHDDIRHLLAEGFRMVREAGTVLWGVNVQVDRRFYREYTPLSLTNIVLGPFLALSGDRPATLRFDQDLWLKEDYDFSLRVLHRYHRILRFNRVHYRVDHQNEAGGVVTHRNMDEEKRQLIRLQERWGSDVVKIQLDRSVNPVIKVPIKGV